uniref:Uncharacterized protein n=1 Tax=Oryza sativa subsp. japonica TaxID=39947 RepID=Q67TP3_ORYSJ|nr:hypothetical protein [Oryza sativa Japonica Group]BAD38478.1 hypothetical protein [Oryza sativa Japonica Group]
MRRVSRTHFPLSPARARARDGRDSNFESRLSFHLHLPHVGRRIPPLPATSEFPLLYLSSAATPSLFFPISPNSPELSIAPVPCTHPPPPLPLLRPPLGAARLAAAPRRRCRWVRVIEVHPVRTSSIEVRRRNPHPLALHLGYNMTRDWTWNCLAMLSSTSTQ